MLAQLYKTEEWTNLKYYFLKLIYDMSGSPNFEYVKGMKHIIDLPKEKYEIEIKKIKKETL